MGRQILDTREKCIYFIATLPFKMCIYTTKKWVRTSEMPHRSVNFCRVNESKRVPRFYQSLFGHFYENSRYYFKVIRLTVLKISTAYLSVLSRRLAMHRKRWNGVSPNPNPTGRASASEPIRRSTSSMLPLYACLSSAAVTVSLVSFSNVSGVVKFSNRRNWLYRGTPLSRSLKMSIVARSRSWKKDQVKKKWNPKKW